MIEIPLELKNEIYKTLEKLGAPPTVLAAVGSIGDTLDNETVLEILQDWNKGTPLITYSGPMGEA